MKIVHVITIQTCQAISKIDGTDAKWPPLKTGIRYKHDDSRGCIPMLYNLAHVLTHKWVRKWHGSDPKWPPLGHKINVSNYSHLKLWVAITRHNLGVKKSKNLRKTQVGVGRSSLNSFLSLHPLCGGGDLSFLLSPPAATTATCFCSHSKTPTQIISKYFQYAYWPWGVCLIIFFLRFSVPLTKSKMTAKILWRTLELEPLHRFVSCLV